MASRGRLPELGALALGALGAGALLFASRSLGDAGAATGELALQRTADELGAAVRERWREALAEPEGLVLPGVEPFAFDPAGPAPATRLEARPDATLRALLGDARGALEAGEFAQAAEVLRAAEGFAPGPAERALVWIERLRLALRRDSAGEPGAAEELGAAFDEGAAELEGVEANGGYPLLALGVIVAAELDAAVTVEQRRAAVAAAAAGLVAALPEPRFEAGGVDVLASGGTAAFERTLGRAVGELPDAWAAAFEQARALELLARLGVEPPAERGAGPRLVFGPGGGLWVAPGADAGVELRPLADGALADWLARQAESGLAPEGFRLALEPFDEGRVGPARALPGAGAEFHVGHRDPAAFVAGEQQRIVGLRRVLLALGALTAFLALASFAALGRQRRLAELQTRFVASVSHELRTPVTAIQLVAENLAAGPAKPERVARYAELLDTEARRLGALVEGVLDAARLERGEGLGLRAAAVEPAAFAAELAAELEALAAGAGFAFEHGTSGLPEAVEVDREALRRAVLNLGANAVLHSGGARLRLHVAGEAGQLVLELHDDGRGLGRREARRLLKPFERGEPLAGAAPKGTGLGLAIAAAVAREHGGELTLGPSDLGGLRARIELPSTPSP